MPNRVPIWARPGRRPVAEPFTWLSVALRVFGVPATVVLWWALAFLPWKVAGQAQLSAAWPPTLPVLFTDLDVAVFGPLGASLVVVAIMGQRLMTLICVLVALVVAALPTIFGGPETPNVVLRTNETQIMLGVSTFTALAGFAIGAVAIGSLRRFGFLGLFAVTPVVSLVAVLVLDRGADTRWLTRSLLVVLLVLIAWRRWSGVLLWPVFFVLFWLLTLAMAALGYGAQVLRPGSNASFVSVSDAMLDLVRSAWRVLLEASWGLFWPAAIIAAFVVAGRYLWQRTGKAGNPVPEDSKPPAGEDGESIARADSKATSREDSKPTSHEDSKPPGRVDDNETRRSRRARR